MKRLLSAVIIIVCVVSGCAGAVSYDGREEIERARRLHTALDGADITMTDNISGIAVQSISYLFSGEVMTYFYKGVQDGRIYCEYNNGTELDWITLPDETQWSFAAKGSEGYYTYSRASRHYFADGARLFAVYEAAISETRRDGGKLTFLYDERKLREYAAFAEMDGISDFSMTYVLDEDGRCGEFTNEYKLDGVKYSYTVKISVRTNPVKREEISEGCVTSNG